MWRGWVGRKIAAGLYYHLRIKKANIIWKFFKSWKYQKMKKINYTVFVNQMTTRIQKMYRLRIIHKIMMAIRTKRRITKSIIIQKYFRSYLGRKKCFFYLEKIAHYRKKYSIFLKDEIVLVFTKGKFNVESLGVLGKKSIEEVMELILFLFLGSKRIELAHQLSQYLILRASNSQDIISNYNNQISNTQTNKQNSSCASNADNLPHPPNICNTPVPNNVISNPNHGIYNPNNVQSNPNLGKSQYGISLFLSCWISLFSWINTGRVSVCVRCQCTVCVSVVRVLCVSVVRVLYVCVSVVRVLYVCVRCPCTVCVCVRCPCTVCVCVRCPCTVCVSVVRVLYVRDCVCVCVCIFV